MSKNRRQLVENGSVNRFLRELLAYEDERCCPHGPYRGVIRKTNGVTQVSSVRGLNKRVSDSSESVGSQAVKRRLGGWCEMAASQL
jgi:hypothetical protein